ncbi:hypothetical protein KPH14_000717, partial [Odynerus spinipes]
RSNIDITLAGRSIAEDIVNWSVTSKCLTSDHNLILFDVIDSRLNSRQINRENTTCAGFNLKRADWDRFVEKLEIAFSNEFLENIKKLEPETAVRHINKDLQDVCSQTIPAMALLIIRYQQEVLWSVGRVPFVGMRKRRLNMLYLSVLCMKKKGMRVYA